MICKIEHQKPDSSTIDFLDYYEQTHQMFLKQFVENKVYYKGKRVSVGSNEAEIEKCFEHITTKGSMDSRIRLPDINRFECIYMLKDILENCNKNQCKNLYIWEECGKVTKEKIFCSRTGYFIILLKRDYVYKIMSAYWIKSNKKRKSLIEECKKYKKKGTP